MRILATDIDTEVLRRAEAGVYPLDRLDGLDTARRRRFLQRGTGPREGLARVREPLRQLVSFRPLNLLDPHWPVRGPFEAVFCRNLMIYFDKPTQYRLLARLAPTSRWRFGTGSIDSRAMPSRCCPVATPSMPMAC